MLHQVQHVYVGTGRGMQPVDSLLCFMLCIAPCTRLMPDQLPEVADSKAAVIEAPARSKAVKQPSRSVSVTAVQDKAWLTSPVALQAHVQGGGAHHHVPLRVQQHPLAGARVQEPKLGHLGHRVLQQTLNQ